jgi:hypothetical protein
MLRVWLVTSVVFFVLVEFYQWVKGFILPLPIYVLGGAFLALASNYARGVSALFGSGAKTVEIPSQTATLLEPPSLPPDGAD